MKRAHQRREYRNVHDWDAPDGIVSVDIDRFPDNLRPARVRAREPSTLFPEHNP